MAVGPVRDDDCGLWERGLDCKFHEGRFHAAILAIWLTTMAAFLTKALRRPRGGCAPTGRARTCLLLAAASAGLCCLDGVCALLFNTPTIHPQAYGYGTFSILGSIALVFSLRTFAHLWADVGGALEGLRRASREYPGSAAETSGPPESFSGRWAFLVVRRSYDGMACAHVPFALATAAAGCSWGPDYSQAMMAWSGWCFLSACVAMSLLALLMWHVVAKYLAGEQRARTFRRVTLANVAEQGLYNAILFASAFLYSTTGYNKYGAMQGLVFVLTFLLLWVMHVQLLLFFALCEETDPLYSKQELLALVQEVSSKTTTSSRPREDVPAPPPRASGTLLGATVVPPAAVIGATQSKPELLL